MCDVGQRLVAYVLSRGEMPRGKLMKILYLIDRELYTRRGFTAFQWSQTEFSSTFVFLLCILKSITSTLSTKVKRGGGASKGASPTRETALGPPRGSPSLRPAPGSGAES